MTRFVGAVLGPLIVLIISAAFTGEIFAVGDAQPTAANPAVISFVAELQKKAAQGNGRAEYLLGCFYNGEEGLPQDSIEAAKWWEKAAAGGVADAQYCIGLSYYLGQGVPKDAEKAAKWWGKAAGQDHAAAQYFLGISYRSGYGVPKNAPLAAYWLKKAAGNGNAAARRALGGPTGPGLEAGPASPR